MSTTKNEPTGRMVTGEELSILAKKVPLLSKLKPEDLSCLGPVELVVVPAGRLLYRQGETPVRFCIVVEGEVRAVRVEARGGETWLLSACAGDTFGEAPMLLGSE